MYTKPMELDRQLYTYVDPGMEGGKPDLFGVEVELEGKGGILGTLKNWAVHNDGSLRIQNPGDEAVEYVFAKPLDLDQTELAVRNLIAHLTRPGVEVFHSYRTSIHVHVNCLQETMRTLYNFITLCLIFDELLVSLNGEHRTGNNFCLRASDAEGQVHELIQSVMNYGNLAHLHPNNRYSAINFVCLNKFGTVEFRSLECTTDFYRIMAWINTVQALKVAARNFGDPREIMAVFSRRGPLGFLLSILGPLAGKYADVPGAQNMLRDGMRIAQDFAFCSEWKALAPGEKLAKARPKRSRGILDMIAEDGPVPNGWGAFQAGMNAAAQPVPQVEIDW